MIFNKKSILKILKLSTILLFAMFYTKVYWVSYANKPISELELKELFSSIDAPETIYDSLNYRGYSIHYLTNKRNYNRPRDEKNKPYLVFLHDSGKNASSFITYFKDKSLSENFHLISIDRPGFGLTYLLPEEERRNSYQSSAKTEIDSSLHSFFNANMVKKVLQKEREHTDKVRVIAHGNAGVYAAGAYSYMALSGHSVHLFSPNLTQKSSIGLVFRKLLISDFVSWSLPRSYINENREIINYYNNLQKNKNYFFDIAKGAEVDWQNFMITLKNYKAIVFHLNRDTFFYDYTGNKREVNEIRDEIAFDKKMREAKAFGSQDILDESYNSIYNNVDQTITSVLDFEYNQNDKIEYNR